MSAANFPQPTLSRVYTIGMEIDEQDEFIAQEMFDNELSSVKEALSQIKNYNKSDRFLPGNVKSVGEFYFDYFNKEYKEWEAITIYVTIENGYYQGAMFDVDLSEFEEIEPSKTLSKEVQSKLNKIERVLSKHTLPLVRVATFSNGEAIYEKAENKRSLLKSIANGYTLA
jgi:hypothetical protein